MKNILSLSLSLCAFVLTAAEPRLGSTFGALFGYSDDPVTMALNIITPVVLTALGLILPKLAKREQEKGLVADE